MDPLSKKIITILATNTVISMLAITYVLICITQFQKINMNLSGMHSKQWTNKSCIVFDMTHYILILNLCNLQSDQLADI